MKTDCHSAAASTMAATVAPEDLRAGDYVAVLNEIVEVCSCHWLELSMHPPEEPVRVRTMSLDAGEPLKVQAVCLPFVFVRHIGGRLETLDIRRMQIVRLSRSYVRAVRKAIRKERERQERESTSGVP
jgi:hypothetical protein